MFGVIFFSWMFSIILVGIITCSVFNDGVSSPQRDTRIIAWMLGWPILLPKSIIVNGFKLIIGSIKLIYQEFTGKL